MKRLLVLASVLAGTVAPYLPANADPHDHVCTGIRDVNCTSPYDGRDCDVWIDLGNPPGGVCHHLSIGRNYVGGCSFATNNDPSGQIANPDTQTGQISGTVLGFDVGGTNPAFTTVACSVTVNGFTVCHTSGSGSPIAAAADVCSYVAADGDVVELCQTITVNGTTLDDTCYPSTSAEFPPQEVDDLIDSIVCPVTRGIGSIFSGIPGVVEFGFDGDIWIAGMRVWNCPPD